MQIDSVGGLSSLLSATGASTATQKDAGASFAALLDDAIAKTNETNASNTQNTLELLSGQDVQLHTTVIEAQKAELAFSLALQVRNKVVDAYNEIMRMQV